MGLVMEQMRRMESVRIGLPASRSLMPWARNQATWPWRMTGVTAPAMRLSPMSRWTVLPMRSRRSDDKPTVSGFTTGWSCVSALLNAAKTKRIRTKHSLRDFCTTFSCSPVLHYCQISLLKEPVGSGRVLGLQDLDRPIAHGIGNAKSDGMGLIIVVPTSQSLIAEENFFR